MNAGEIKTLMRQIAPVFQAFVGEAIAPLVARIDAFEAREPPRDGKDADAAKVAALVHERIAGELAELRSIVEAIPEVPELPELPDIGGMIDEAVAAIPKPRDGEDADMDAVAALIEAKVKDLGEAITAEAAGEIRAEVALAIAAIPQPKDGEDGRSVDLDDVRPMVDELVSTAVSALPVPENGKDADPELIAELVERAVAALPPAEPGNDADPEMIEILVADKVSEAVSALPPPEKGDPGPMGALPVVRAWEDGVHYQGEVVTFDGGLFQAARDTGKAPPHEDWTGIVSRGEDGKAADEIEVKGTYAPDEDYARLNIVALNGAAFMARKDAPGPCPGEGWQMIAMQGKQGKPGSPGQKGDRGLAVTAAVTGARVSEQGLLVLVNADGSTVECDLYPLLEKIGG